MNHYIYVYRVLYHTVHGLCVTWMSHGETLSFLYLNTKKVLSQQVCEVQRDLIDR